MNWLLLISCGLCCFAVPYTSSPDVTVAWMIFFQILFAFLGFIGYKTFTV